MTYKANIAPLCRSCGKPIGKVTSHVSFGEYGSLNTITPLTLAEAQRHVNGKIVSLRWRLPTRLVDSETIPTGEPRYVHTATVWDGESYRDQYFCRDRCAVGYAYMVAQSPHNQCQSVAYADAMRERRGIKL